MPRTMTRRDVNRIGTGNEELIGHLCDAARNEGRKDMAALLSVHLDRLAAEAQNRELSNVEILELMRQEAEKWGRAWN